MKIDCSGGSRVQRKFLIKYEYLSKEIEVSWSKLYSQMDDENLWTTQEKADEN